MKQFYKFLKFTALPCLVIGLAACGKLETPTQDQVASELKRFLAENPEIACMGDMPESLSLNVESQKALDDAYRHLAGAGIYFRSPILYPVVQYVITEQGRAETIQKAWNSTARCIPIAKTKSFVVESIGTSYEQNGLVVNQVKISLEPEGLPKWILSEEGRKNLAPLNIHEGKVVRQALLVYKEGAWSVASIL